MKKLLVILVVTAVALLLSARAKMRAAEAEAALWAEATDPV